MRVIIAETSGFCGGVKRAMRLAVEAAASHGGLVSDGPLVHNAQALALLSLHDIESGPAAAAGRPLLIRAHGVPPERRLGWLEEGRVLVDATCPHVARNQRLAAEAAQRGRFVLLAGDADHAEVRAVAGMAGGNCLVVETPADLLEAPADRPLFLLAQTTFSVDLFRELADALCRLHPDAEVADSICRATAARQDEARQLAGRVEAVVVVGGRDSANTRRLSETCERYCRTVVTVETASELTPEAFAGMSTVGVISGASTPGWITQDVVNRLRPMGRRSPGSLLMRIALPLVQSRATTAASALGLALAAQFWLLGRLWPAIAVAGSGFVFFAHTLNRRVPVHPEARRLSLTDTFYQNRRSKLLSLAWFGAGLALLFAWTAGPTVLTMFTFALAAAAAYAYGSRRRRRGLGPVGARVFLRSVFMAGGWALTLAAPPLVTGVPAVNGLPAVLFVFLVCAGGNLLRDLRDIASDSLMGMETIPARIGVAASRRVAAALLGLSCLLPVLVGSVVQSMPTAPRHTLFLLLLPVAPFLGLVLLWLLVRRRLNDDVQLQAGVDGMGCIAGILALILGTPA